MGHKMVQNVDFIDLGLIGQETLFFDIFLRPNPADICSIFGPGGVKMGVLGGVKMGVQNGVKNGWFLGRGGVKRNRPRFHFT